MDSILKKNIQGAVFEESGMDTIVSMGPETVVLSRDKDGDIYFKFRDQANRDWSIHCTYSFNEMKIQRSDSEDFFYFSTRITREFLIPKSSSPGEDTGLGKLDKKIAELNFDLSKLNSMIQFGRRGSLIYLNRPFVATSKEWKTVSHPCAEAFRKLEEVVSVRFL